MTSTPVCINTHANSAASLQRSLFAEKSSGIHTPTVKVEVKEEDKTPEDRYSMHSVYV